MSVILDVKTYRWQRKPGYFQKVLTLWCSLLNLLSNCKMRNEICFQNTSENFNACSSRTLRKTLFLPSGNDCVTQNWNFFHRSNLNISKLIEILPSQNSTHAKNRTTGDKKCFLRALKLLVVVMLLSNSALQLYVCAVLCDITRSAHAHSNKLMAGEYILDNSRAQSY